MYSFLHDLLSDQKGGRIFELFGAWHFFYIALTVVAVVRDPFYAIPAHIAPFVMPFLNIAIFFAVTVVIRLVASATKSVNLHRKGIQYNEK